MKERSLRQRAPRRRRMPFRHAPPPGRGPARGLPEAGAVIFEAAFASLLFFTLVVAVFEIGMALRSNLSVANTVRAGARGASALGNESRADMYVLINIEREASALADDDIQRIVVYKPSRFGEEPTESCKNGAPSAGVCNVYYPQHLDMAIEQLREEQAARDEGRPVNQSKIVFGCKSTSPDRYWCPSSRKVTMSGSGPEYVGVWMQAEHEWVTKLFGNSRTIRDQSIIRLEPRTE